MPNLSDVKMGGFLKCVLKGPPGTAKSCAALSFPKPMYIFDVDGRIKSLAKWVYESGFKDLLDGVEYDTYNASKYLAFNQKRTELKAHCKYKTVVLDSLTAMADLLIEYSNSVRGAGGKKAGIIAIPGMEEYQAEWAGLSQSMEIFRNLECNFILVAHEVEVSTKQLNSPDKIERRLLTAGKPIAAKLPAYFGQIFNFEVETPINVGEKNKYIVRAEHGGDHWARTELPLPAKMDITGKRFYDVLREECAKKGIDLEQTTNNK